VSASPRSEPRSEHLAAGKVNDILLVFGPRSAYPPLSRRDSRVLVPPAGLRREMLGNVHAPDAHRARILSSPPRVTRGDASPMKVPQRRNPRRPPGNSPASEGFAGVKERSVSARLERDKQYSFRGRFHPGNLCGVGRSDRSTFQSPIERGRPRLVEQGGDPRFRADRKSFRSPRLYRGRRTRRV